MKPFFCCHCLIIQNNKGETMIAITIPIIFIIVTGIVIFYFIRARHEERMTILEKGTDKEQLEYLFKEHKREHNPLNFIKYGLLLISIGAAICTITFYEEEVTAGLIFILPGISLILYYFIAKRLQKNE
jgi:uncharacterized membrane protein